MCESDCVRAQRITHTTTDLNAHSSPATETTNLTLPPERALPTLQDGSGDGDTAIRNNERSLARSHINEGGDGEEASVSMPWISALAKLISQERSGVHAAATAPPLY